MKKGDKINVYVVIYLSLLVWTTKLYHHKSIHIGVQIFVYVLQHIQFYYKFDIANTTRSSFHTHKKTNKMKVSMTFKLHRILTGCSLLRCQDSLLYLLKVVVYQLVYISWKIERCHFFKHS